VLKPLHDLRNGIQKVGSILTVCHVSRVAPRWYPAVDKGKLGPQHPVLSELIKALGQTQEQLKMMGKNGRLLSEDPTPLQLIFKVTECSAAIYLHEFCLEEAFNGISSHLHGTTPSPSVEQDACIIQTMCARLRLFAYASIQIM